jgi:hypothetical protein
VGQPVGPLPRLQCHAECHPTTALFPISEISRSLWARWPGWRRSSTRRNKRLSKLVLGIKTENRAGFIEFGRFLPNDASLDAFNWKSETECVYRCPSTSGLLVVPVAVVSEGEGGLPAASVLVVIAASPEGVRVRLPRNVPPSITVLCRSALSLRHSRRDSSPRDGGLGNCPTHTSAVPKNLLRIDYQRL